GRALADVAAVWVDAAHRGLRGEGDEVRPERVHVALAEAVLLLREHDDAAPLRSLVGERRELRGVGEPFHRSAVTGEKGRRLAIAERDRPGLVEQEDVHVARRLDGAARDGDDV